MCNCYGVDTCVGVPGLCDLGCICKCTCYGVRTYVWYVP